jgi:putative aldouronate transport system permease protein
MRKKKRRKNQLSMPVKVLNRVMLGVLFLSMVIPLLNVLAIAFSTRQGSMSPGLLLWPTEWSFDGFIYIWTRENLWRPFFNSLFVTSVGTLFQVFLSAIAGYILMKRDLPFRRAIMAFIMVTMMIPGELTLVSIYTLYRDLNLLNTYTGLIVNGLVSGFSILLLKNYFESIPHSVSEAAALDKAGELKIFLKIYLPLAIPGLATVSFISFVSKWNTLMVPVTIITDYSKYTLPMVLQSLVFHTTSTSGTDVVAPNAIMAAIVISVVPLIIVYIIAQRFLVNGMTIGAVKG